MYFTFVEKATEEKTKGHHRHCIRQIEKVKQRGIRKLKQFVGSSLKYKDDDGERNGQVDKSLKKPGEPVNGRTHSHHPQRFL
jgi:hypothetical protein